MHHALKIAGHRRIELHLDVKFHLWVFHSFWAITWRKQVLPATHPSPFDDRRHWGKWSTVQQASPDGWPRRCSTMTNFNKKTVNIWHWSSCFFSVWLLTLTNSHKYADTCPIITNRQHHCDIIYIMFAHFPFFILMGYFKCWLMVEANQCILT